LPRQHRRRALRVLLDVLREPMLALLLAGGAIYLLLGEAVDAVVLLVLPPSR
jgi:Ca2+-transporting ATPase